MNFIIFLDYITWYHILLLAGITHTSYKYIKVYLYVGDVGDIEPFFWKISQYLGSGWHNWSPNVATVTGWTKCFTKEVPVLRDTLYKQWSLDQEHCWFMWKYLVTALGNLLIFPIDMYLIYVTISVFYFAISLESLLSSSWSQS